MKKIASIDLGTNTFQLLIAHIEQGRLIVDLEDQQFVRLGKGGISKGEILPDAMQRAIHALTSFKKIIDQHDIEEVFAIGTSAIRSATNQGEFVKLMKEKTGISIQVINGVQEAGTIYWGVKSSIEWPKDTSLVMDIGGGSCEFIIADAKEIKWKASFEIGAQRLLDLFFKKDPIPANEIINLESFIEKETLALSDACKKWQPKQLIGSAGTFDTLKDVHTSMNNGIIPKVLEEKDLVLLFDLLINQPREKRLSIPGLITQRADMIVLASCMLRKILKINQLDTIYLANGSLKEGVAYQQLTLHPSLS